MKKTRQLASVAGAVALVTGAASLALIGGGSATAAGTPSSAFGIELSLAGNDLLPASTVQAISTDGSKVTDELISLPVDPVISGGVVTALAENGHARASVADLGVGQGLLAQLPAELTAPLGDLCGQLAPVIDGVINNLPVDDLTQALDGLLGQIGNATAGTPLNLTGLADLDLTNLAVLNNLQSLCDVLTGQGGLVNVGAVIAECNGNSGTTTIEGLNVAGLVDSDLPTAPNTTVKVPDLPGVPPLIELVINRQTSNADGTFTVDGLYLNVLDQVKGTIASATCGNVTKDKPKNPTDAPSPTPVETHVPVTG